MYSYKREKTITTSNLLLLEHDLSIMQLLLQMLPPVVQLINHVLNILRNDHLVLVQQHELIGNDGELSLNRGLLAAYLLPHDQALSQLFHRVRYSRYPAGTHVDLHHQNIESKSLLISSVR